MSFDGGLGLFKIIKMKIKLLTVSIFLIVPLLVHSQDDNFYWVEDKKQFFEIDSTELLIEVNITEQNKINQLKSDPDISNYRTKNSNTTQYIVKQTRSLDFINRNQLNSNKKVYPAIHERGSGATAFITDEISVKFFKEPDLKTFTSKYGLETVEKTSYGAIIFKVLDSKSTLKIANKIKENESVFWSNPNFVHIINLYQRVNDPLYSNQYYLNNTGQTGGVQNIDINAPQAWDITLGCDNIRVAVIDDGVENHEDFDGRVMPGFTAGFNNTNGAPLNHNSKGHGVACAGIIAASHNDLGIRGIAPNSQIIPINIFPLPPAGQNFAGVVTNAEIATAINWAWRPDRLNSDILSNSWGGGVENSDVTFEINQARTQGRNGLGAIVIFASGNIQQFFPGVTFPANVSGVITVGAIDKNGTIWNYSNRGPQMDLVAPTGSLGSGDVVTTDREGTLGYDPGEYFNNFGGTSASCPQVSGVAALMLSVNPNLTETQVRTILQQTATDMGPNGFDNTFGYGRLNAHAAVQAALPTISGPTLVCTTNSTFNLNNLPAGATVTWSASSNLNISSFNDDQAVIDAINGMVGGEAWPVVNNGWIEANIITDCGETSVREYFWVGRPPTPTADVDRQPIFYNLSLDGVPSEICVSPMSQTGDFYAGGIAGFGHSFVNHWETDAGSIYGNSSPTEYSAVTVNMNNYGYRYIRVRAENACGYSAWVTRYFDLVYEPNGCGPGGGGIGFAMQYSPNPVAGILTVDITPAEKAEAQSNEYLVTLNNKYGKVVYTHKSNDLCHSIDMQSLEKGLYRLVVQKDGEQHIAKIYKD